ncbi:MAG: hypothetical protein ACKVG0_05620 [Alphaproteobacteria bacterium]
MTRSIPTLSMPQAGLAMPQADLDMQYADWPGVKAIARLGALYI